MFFVRVSFIPGLLFSLLFTSVSYADTKIVTEYYNLATGGFEESIVSVTHGKIRIDRPSVDQQRYEIIDLIEQKKYLVDQSDNITLVSDLNPGTDYKARSSLQKVGKGPVLLSGEKTTHYLFQADNITCNHIYIADIKDSNVNEYLKNFTMVPVKVEGAWVQPEEKACQKAARDAASEIKKIGVPLLIKGKNDQTILFSIKEISKVADYPKSIFHIEKKNKAQSFESLLKNEWEIAMADMAYEKFLKKLDNQNLTKKKKEQMRKEATAAYEKGEFLKYLEMMAANERVQAALGPNNGGKVENKISDTPESLPVAKLAGYMVSAGSKNGEDHAIYQMNYQAMTFGCDKDATMSMASHRNKFDITISGTYVISGNELIFHSEENDASNSLVGLLNEQVVIGKTRFEGQQGMAVDAIRKVKECP